MNSFEEVLILPSVTFEDRKNLPDLKGVYFVVVENKELVYIGMTVSSFLKRWRDHSVAWAIKRVLANAPNRGWNNPLFRIHYFEMPNSTREEIHALEQHLIKKVFNRPIWNQKSGGIKYELIVDVFAVTPDLPKSDFTLAYEAYWRHIEECCQNGTPYQIDERYNIF